MGFDWVGASVVFNFYLEMQLNVANHHIENPEKK